MVVDKTTFISVWDDLFSDEIIDDFIEYYDCMDREYPENFIRRCDDNRIRDSSLDASLISKQVRVSRIDYKFLDIFYERALSEYMNEFFLMEQMSNLTVYDMRIQKTIPGEGYHIWHCENTGSTSLHRVLAFTLYLNDVEQGGETEFLYQSTRIQAKRGRLVIWPAYFTHPHRGNPPLCGDKYILTGWVEYS